MKETSGFKNINDIQNTIEMQIKSFGKYIYYFNVFTNSTFKKKNRNKIIIKYQIKIKYLKNFNCIQGLKASENDLFSRSLWI